MKTYPKNKTAVIVAGFRTPFMFSGRGFKNMKEEELGASAVKELIERTPIKAEEVEELIVGSSESPHNHLAQAIVQLAGLPKGMPAWTVKNKDLSSLESLIMATIKINQGVSSVVIAGGVDNISQKPFLVRSNKAQEIINTRRWKEKAQLLFSLRPFDIEWQSQKEDPLFNGNQGLNYDTLFARFSVSYTEQESFVSQSFKKARKAYKEGKAKEEIIPVFPPFDFDLKEVDEALSPPLFTKALLEEREIEDLVCSRRQALTADGAVFFLIMSKEKAQALGFVPLVSLPFFAYNDPKKGEHQKNNQALGPLYAVSALLKKAGLLTQDIDLWEIGESHPAQTLTCLKGFASLGKENFSLEEIDPDKLNVNGGALALGDPLGATSARMVLSLMKEMKRRQVKWGLATMGFYSHQAGALLLKNELQ